VIWNTVLPTFAIIGTGVLYGRLTDARTSQISDYILYVGAPCLIITSLVGRSFDMSEMFLLIGSSLLLMFVPGIIGLLVLDRKRDRSLFLPVMFQNAGALGLPVALFAWGDAGMSKAIVLYATTAICLYSIAVWIAAGKGGWKEAFKLPLIYAVMVPIVMNNLGYSIPEPILKPIDMIGATTIPLLMFILGVFLSRAKKVALRKTAMGVTLRLGVGIITGIAIVTVFHIQELTRDVILLYSIMPSGIMTTVLADRYGGDPELVSSVVFTTTVVSLVLIPIFLY